MPCSITIAIRAGDWSLRGLATPPTQPKRGCEQHQHPEQLQPAQQRGADEDGAADPHEGPYRLHHARLHLRAAQRDSAPRAGARCVSARAWPVAAAAHEPYLMPPPVLPTQVAKHDRNSISAGAKAGPSAESTDVKPVVPRDPRP